MSQIREAVNGIELEVVAFVDATLRHRLSAPEKERLHRMIDQAEAREVPAGQAADSFLLEWAHRNGAIVVSNDRFLEYRERYPWLAALNPTRRVSGTYDPRTRRWTLFGQSARGVPPPSLALLIQKAASDGTKGTKPPVVVKGESPGEYRAKVTTANPHAVVILLDQSGSMISPWGNTTRADRLAAIVNDTIRAMVLKATRREVRHYFDLAVLGYGGDRDDGVRSMLPGTSVLDPFRSIADIARIAETRTITINDRPKKVPVWVKAHAGGKTPMGEALDAAHRAISEHARIHQRSFPPIVINITDGEHSFKDPVESAEAIKTVRTVDGAALVFAARICAAESSGAAYPVAIPHDASIEERSLFKMSSVVPATLRAAASEMGIVIKEGGRACLFDASPDALINMLNVGTQGTTDFGGGEP